MAMASTSRDLVKAYVRLFRSAASTNPYNICSTGSRSLPEMIHAIANLSSPALKITANSTFGRGNEVLRLVDTEQRMEHHFGAQQRTLPNESVQCMLASQV